TVFGAEALAAVRVAPHELKSPPISETIVGVLGAVGWVTWKIETGPPAWVEPPADGDEGPSWEFVAGWFAEKVATPPPKFVIVMAPPFETSTTSPVTSVKTWPSGTGWPLTIAPLAIALSSPGWV